MRHLAAFVCAVCAAAPAGAQRSSQSDTFPLAGGNLVITFLGHASLMLEYAGSVVLVDPVSAEADYARLPKATLILVTHNHSDHLDAAAIHAASTAATVVVLNPASAKQLGFGTPLANGERTTVSGIGIEAFPAYNTSAGRDRFHPKGRDNGYLINLGGKRIYVAGDTEDTPELLALRDVWIAFLPMNQPYTMTPPQVAAVARAVRPAVLYPYHYGESDTASLVALLKADKDIDVRVRSLK